MALRIREQRTDVFLEMTQAPLPEHLERVRAAAADAGVPIIRRPVQGLLKTLITYARPMSILEIGTAVGFSALLMREYAPKEARIVTMECDPDRIRQAKENFAAAGGGIELICGDAAQTLKDLTGPFDLIFLDAAKGQYPVLLPEIKRLLAPGGMLVTDNCLQDGDVLEPRFAVKRRDRTIHGRMREYLYEICHDEELESCILPLADGVSLSVRKSGTDAD